MPDVTPDSTLDPTPYPPARPAGPSAGPAVGPRHVLFITVDQWRADCLSIAGHPVVRTPNLDALAAEGVRFGRHYAQCTPCGPSRASIHTGMYQHNHRVVNNGTPLDDRFTNLAKEARARGFDPWLFGYTDTALDPRQRSSNDPRLFTYEAVMDGWSSPTPITENDPPWVAHLASLGYSIPANFFDLYAQQNPYPPGAGRGSSFAPMVIPAEHSETTFLTDNVINHIKGRTVTAMPGEPGFFIHASYLRPHPPWVAPEGYHDRYHPKDVPAFVRHDSVDEEMAQHPFLAGALRLNAVRAPVDDDELRQLAATYYGLMSQVDDELGRLFSWLRATGLWDQTLVIVTADHGEQMGDHHLVQKLGFFEQSYHVPMIIRDPTAAAASSRGTLISESFTENVDLLPTILDWLGANQMPLQCDGRSLVPFLRGEVPVSWRTDAYWEFDFRNPMVPDQLAMLGLRMEHSRLAVLRTDTHKYVHFPAMPPLLYDLTVDPGELHNVAAHPDQRDIRLELAERLLSRRMVADDRTFSGTLLGPWGIHTADDRLR